ncbi:hypothetical protein ACROYT_G023370 [Oculina patagonica]
MEKKIARVIWSRGRYSDVYRTCIVDPSPIKQGQQVKVLWGKTKKECSAVIECYPLEAASQENSASPEVLAPRKTKAKRKLISESSPAKKKTATKAKTSATKEKPKKQKQRGKILDVMSPTKDVVETSEDSSDSDDEFNAPLGSLIARRPLPIPPQTETTREVSPPPIDDIGDYSDAMAIPDVGDLIHSAMQRLDHVTEVSRRDDTATELRLLRTIMERLECSFARQKAKLDKLLSQTSVPVSSVQQTPQCRPPPPPQFSTPELHSHRSFEFLQSAQMNADLAGQFPPLQRTPLPDVDALLSDADLTDTVAVGGSENVRLAKNDFTFIKAASKPSAMALRLADKLFPKTTLVRSTVHGTKDFDPLDPTRISAIKAEVMRSFSHQCRNEEEIAKMWETCKISIGKRCQNLRKFDKNGRDS